LSRKKNSQLKNAQLASRCQPKLSPINGLWEVVQFASKLAASTAAASSEIVYYLAY
jgi:hypothetical protein